MQRGTQSPYVLSTDGTVCACSSEGGLPAVLRTVPGKRVPADSRSRSGPATPRSPTDGVTEAQNAEEELWGEERLLDAARPSGRVVSAHRGEVLPSCADFSGDEPQSDDITLLLARWLGPAEVAPESVGEEAVTV
ncbi:MAG: SpoIIE family protein phosphatase [Candidatus Eisenbacteria bacterium]